MNELLKNAKSWPFEEARRIYEKINKSPRKNDFVLFETGYGPSGLPHIGTFGEVVRTSFVRYAFTKLYPDIKTELWCVSDDIDGLRKVPDNIPNQEIVKENLGKPLTSVPDPFNIYESYGHHMNARLRGFLDHFGFDYKFISATEKYKSGAFDQTMLRVLEKYEELMDLMLPTLGDIRQETYSPFMPIDEESGIVIDKGVIGVDKKRSTVIYKDLNGKEKEVSVTKGNCKLQWKIDFGARWYSLGVDYEIYGKDHQPNEKIYRSVCEILGGIAPVNFTYEMFLSDSGEKISKSKGNGISVEDWLKYSPWPSLSLFMYQKPKTAKRLYFDVIPKAMDEYLAFVDSYNKETEDKRLENPAFFIHGIKSSDQNEVPIIHNLNINYSLLLNLASACNPENDSVLMGFISRYQNNNSKVENLLMNEMVNCAINYYNDFIKKNKKFKVPNDIETKALIELKDKVQNCNFDEVAKSGSNSNEGDLQIISSTLQNLVFEVGRNNGYEKNMRDWFLLLYQVLLGQEQGPRMGSFIAIFGKDNFIKLIAEKIKQI